MNSSCKGRASRGRTLRCLVFLFLLGVCPAGRAEVVDRIVVVVNDEIITLSEINLILEPFADRLRSMNHPSERERTEIFNARRQIIDRLIEDKLKDQEIRKYDIAITDSEADLAIEDIKQTHGYTDEDLRKALAAERMSMEDYRNRIREQILRARLINYRIKSKIVVTNEDVAAYYDAHDDVYGGVRRYRLRNIIMPESDDGPEQMEAAHRRLMEGEDFAALAREYSRSPLAASGGSLGLFDAEDLSPEIRSAVQGLNAGEFTPVLRTEHGLQIFLVEAIETLPGRKLEDVRAEIEEKLYQDIVNRKFREWLTELRQQAHIKIVN